VAVSLLGLAVRRLSLGLLVLFTCVNSLQAVEGDIDDVDGVVRDGYRLKYSVATTASKTTIWRLWSDVENWRKFDTLLEYSRLDEGHEFEQGARGVIKADGASKTRFVLSEVTPGESFTEKLFVPLYQTIDLKRYFEESESGRTVFTHEVVFRGRLRFLIHALAAGTFEKELPLVMGRLKDVAEQEEDLEK